MLTLLVAKIALARLDAKKLNGFVAAKDHEEWRKAREIVSRTQIAKIDKVRVLAKEKIFNNEGASFNFF